MIYGTVPTFPIFLFPHFRLGKDIQGDHVSCLIYNKRICRGVIYFWCARGRAARPRIKPPLDYRAVINQTPGWQSSPCSYDVPSRPLFAGYVVVALLPSTIHCHSTINWKHGENFKLQRSLKNMWTSFPNRHFYLPLSLSRFFVLFFFKSLLSLYIRETALAPQWWESACHNILQPHQFDSLTT